MQTTSYYHHDDRRLCEPAVEVEYDVPTRESESWSACDTPAADAEKEEAIPDKTDWDFIAPGEPKPAAEVPRGATRREGIINIQQTLAGRETSDPRSRAYEGL
jgi:hypothetical protein